MNKFRVIFILGMVFCLLNASGQGFCQQPPASQTAGGVIRRDKEMQKQKALETKIGEKKLSPEEVISMEILADDSGPKVMIKKIVVEGVTLLTQEEIQKVISSYEGNELSLAAMQKIADLITDEYRKKGYVTSRAYIPPQTMRDGILTIRVVEGKLGQMDIKGNKHFSTRLLEKKIDIEPTGYFDYSALQRSLVYINEHPDRTAKAILVPGKEPGTTDIVIEVEDNVPFHVGLEYDNYGSRYIDKNRFSVTVEHNNVTGHDDKIFAKFQRSEGDHLLLQQGRYAYPLTSKWEVGGHLIFSQLELGEEFEDLRSEGDASIYGIFTNYTMIEKENFEMRMNAGLDVKDIQNDLLGIQISRDQLSVAKLGFDMDVSDRWGRTVFTAEINSGIPDFLGSMADKDSDASRTGAGGKFNKGVFNLFRLQPMPFMTSLLWKNSFQYTNNTLAASEQFQIGGATSVRGYPPGERSGDNGFYSALELSLPFYGLSKDVKIPFREEKLYDTFRFVLFGDVGMVNLNVTQAGEKENYTLRSAGFGGRLTLANDLECRIEVGYPLGGETPSDGDHAHKWIEFRIKF